MITINEISEALNSPIFEAAMNKIEYFLLPIDSFCQDEYWFENKDGNLIYFNKSDMEYICYTKARTVSLNNTNANNSQLPKSDAICNTQVADVGNGALPSADTSQSKRNAKLEDKE